MKMNSATRRFAAWIAFWAILLAALAPSISYAIAANSGSADAWMEICSTSGIKFVKITDNQNPAKSQTPTEKATHLKHCPYCLTHAGTFALPASVHINVPVVRISHVLPPLFYQSPRPLFMWAATQSRAPPSIS